MIKIGNERTDYGNWVPAAMMKTCYMVAIVLAALELIGVVLVVNRAIGGVLAVSLLAIVGVLFVIVLIFTLYMKKCRDIFDFNKGGLMGKVHQNLVDHLEWDGNGQLLDIGCGAGALTIRCAKTFSNAVLKGMDYWGTEWNYAKEQCESNAKAEGVDSRITFQKGDAAKLDFEDESFDAAVSNFVFHEVRTQPDKRMVVKEALRVVKKGGAFAFQDMFSQKTLYGDMNEFVEILKQEGIAEVHYIGNLEKQDFIPDFVTAPWMLQGVGLLYGKK